MCARLVSCADVPAVGSLSFQDDARLGTVQACAPSSVSLLRAMGRVVGCFHFFICFICLVSRKLFSERHHQQAPQGYRSSSLDTGTWGIAPHSLELSHPQITRIRVT